MSRTRIEYLEKELGDPSEFIITHENRNMVIQWAILQGHPSVQVHAMRNVDLANLYHKNSPLGKTTDEQALAADMFVKMVNAFQIAQVDRSMVQELIVEELKKLPAKKLEITTPRGSVILEGTLHYRTELIMKIVAANHPVMMVGPAGCGKTSIGEKIAEGLQLPFYATSTINDTHELTGFVDGHSKYHSTPFRQAFENGGVWIADEIDAWDASALLAANSALANGFSTFPDMAEPLVRHKDFRMIATANTFGSGASRVYVGRNELDAASLDRFAVIDVDYDLTLEQLFARGNDRWLNKVWKTRKRVEEKKVRHVVSSRAIIMGATALEIGIDWADVEEIYLFKGMSETDCKKISGKD